MLFLSSLLSILFLKNKKTFHSAPHSLVFQEVFKFSTLSVLFSKPVQEAQELLEVNKRQGEKTLKGVLSKMPFALAVGWLVFRAKESGTSHFSAGSWKEISVCRVLFIFRGGSPCPQPWPLSLSLWYCGTWRSSDPIFLFQLFLQGSSPS